MSADQCKRSRLTIAISATAACALFTCSLLALLLMHVLRPDYSPASHMISEYALGPYGWVMATCFLAMGFGCLMLLFGLAGSNPGTLAAWIGTLLLGIPSIGLAVSAFFPMDAPGAPPTRTGDIHQLSFLANVVSIFLASVLLSVGPWRHPCWRGHWRRAIALSWLIAFALVLQFLTLRRGAPFGLANRFFAASLFTWFFATSFRLRALARG